MYICLPLSPFLCHDCATGAHMLSFIFYRLKDSDVTWLYGPLHTAADWAQLSRQLATPSNSIQTSLSSIETTPSSSLTRNSRSGSSRSNSPWALKSILKHRSISELLAVPFPSPHSEQLELEEDPYFRRSSSSGTIHGYIAKSEPTNLIRKRPKLTHARSDTNVHRHNPFRGDSPPLPLIPEDPLSLPSSVEHHDCSSSDSNNSSQPPPKKRITFNTFVEQRIAIEKPNKLRDAYYTDAEVDVDGDGAFGDEGYDQDDEISNEDDSDDDILQMKSSAYLCPGKNRRRLSSASSSTASYGTVYDTSAEREHVTIAPIAPTILKTSAVSSPITASRGIWEEDVEIEDVECLFAGMTPPSSSILELEQADDGVNLVFAPPQGSVYAERLAMNGNVPSTLNGKEAAAALVRVLGTSPTTHLSKPIHAPSFYDDDDDDEILYDPQSKTRVPSPSFGTQFVRVPPPSVQDNMDGSSSLTRAAVLKNTPSDVRTSEADVLSTGSKGSGSASEEGTIVAPQTLPIGASIQTTSTNIRASPTKRLLDDHDSPSPVRSYVKTSRAQFHIHQVPSPARSTTSTGTSTTTTSNGSTSGVSYGSPLLEPPPRDRSISPVTSASPSRDGSRGRSGSIGKANGSSMSLADDRDEPARGRSRSRSIGSSPLEGSVSPRSGSRSRLVNGRGSLDNLGGYSCGTPRLGSFNSPVWREASLSPEELDGRREGRSTKPRRTGSGLVERERSTGGRDESSLSPPSHPSPSGSYVKDRVSRVATKTVNGVTVSETPNVSNSPSLVSSARTSLPAVPENPAPSSLASFTPPTPEILLVPVAKSKPIDIPAPSLSSSQSLSASKNVLTAPAHLPTPLPDLAGPVTAPAIMEAINTLPAVLPSLIPVPPPAPPSISTPTAPTPVSSSSSTPTTPRASNFEESALSRAVTSARGYLGSLWNSNTAAGVVVVNERQAQAQVQHAR